MDERSVSRTSCLCSHRRLKAMLAVSRWRVSVYVPAQPEKPLAVLPC